MNSTTPKSGTKAANLRAIDVQLYATVHTLDVLFVQA